MNRAAGVCNTGNKFGKTTTMWFAFWVLHIKILKVKLQLRSNVLGSGVGLCEFVSQLS